MIRKDMAKQPLAIRSAAAFICLIYGDWLFCKCVSEEIAIAVTGCNNGITVGIFRNVDNGESAVLFDICFRTVCFHLDQFFLRILFAAASIDIFNKDFIFVHRCIFFCFVMWIWIIPVCPLCLLSIMFLCETNMPLFAIVKFDGRLWETKRKISEYPLQQKVVARVLQVQSGPIRRILGGDRCLTKGIPFQIIKRLGK